jgi:DNA repair protein RadD
MANLRGYQRDLNARVRQSWAEGNRVVMGVLPTGGGKTVCMGDIAHNHNGWGTAIAHRSELVGQISRALASEGITHAIVAAKDTQTAITREHYKLFGKSFVNNSRADWAVASVDTIIRQPHNKYFERSTLAIEDEGHHALKLNKWGRVFGMFAPACLGLLLTATPCRTDGAGLGFDFAGIVNAMVEGPGMRWMIDQGYLTDYTVICPDVADLDLSKVKKTATGELSGPQLAEAMRKCPQIVGDVVRHYLEHARGKRGITFAINLDEARKIADAFNAAGVPAAVVSSESTPDERRRAIEQLETGQLLQLVNVDLFGEGFDLPAIEVVSMARPTASLSLFYQQWGRALRLMISPVLQAAWDTYTPEQRKAFIAASGKPRAIIIDHVGNLFRHEGPPDKFRVWSLASSQSGRIIGDAIPLRSCESCHKPFERLKSVCPYCGIVQTPPDPALRSDPKKVDGDLFELSPEKLAEMRAGVRQVDGPIHAPAALRGTPAERSLQTKHAARQRAQQNLRYVIACWAGMYRNDNDRTNYRRFFHTFGCDVVTACALPAREADEMRAKIEAKIKLAGAIINGLPFPDTNPITEVA